MMDFKKYSYLIIPFRALQLRLSGKECDVGKWYSDLNTDVIHGGRFAVCVPSKR